MNETSSPPQWFMRNALGGIYGPASLAQLQVWVQEGRLNRECELSDSIPYHWQPAEVCLPVLFAKQPSEPISTSPTVVVPQRGAWLMVLASMGLLCVCPVFSISAWVMATSDLREIAAGKRERSGHSLTLAAWWLSVITATLWISMALFAFMIAMQRAAATR